MKNLSVRLGMLVFLAFFAFAGCAEEKEEAAVQEETTAEEVGRKTGEAMETTGDYVGEKAREASEFAKETTDRVAGYTSERREDYQAKMNDWLTSFDDRLAELKSDFGVVSFSCSTVFFSVDTGKYTRKTVPLSGSLYTVILPLWAFKMPMVTDNPIPRPVNFVEKKGSTIFPISSLDIPQPVSDTSRQA